VPSRASSISGRGAVLLAAWLAASLAAAAPCADAHGAAPTAGGAGSAPAVLAVRAAPGSEPTRVLDALEAAGWRVHVALLPETFYVSERSGSRGLPAGVRALDARPVLLAPTAPASGGGDPFGGRADALPPFSREARAAAASRAGIAPPGSVPPEGLPWGSRWEDTSEFMIGRVAVPILFAESDGTIDPNHFDWTPALRDSVVNAAVRGLLKWSVFAATRNIPLTFLIEPRPGLATRYEPIDRPIGQEALWIADVLQPLLGYRGDALSMAYEYANGARARWNAQWATIAFAVQNDSSATGTFPDGFIAHSNLGGPWFVMPVNNLNTTSATLDYYFEHEMTHQFWALDEYPALNAWWACTLTTGYFNRPNWNASVPADGYCGVPTVQCLMKGNYPDSWCSYTTDQVGWADLDGTGILDLYETRASVRPDSTTYRTGAGLPILLRGRANEGALPNRNPYHSGAGDSISLGVVDSIEYRLDNVGAWTPIPCLDGRCDSGEERFAVTLDPLTIGSHVVEWRAWNTNGRTALTPSSTVIQVSGGSPSWEGGSGSARAAPRVTAAPSPMRGEARLVLSARPGSRGTAAIHDLAGRAIRVWPVVVPESGVLSWRWDARAEGGGAAPAGLYFVIVKIGPDTATHRVLLLR